jgi:hypothetical protein
MPECLSGEKFNLLFLIYEGNFVLLKSRHETLRPSIEICYVYSASQVFQMGKILSSVEEQIEHYC